MVKSKKLKKSQVQKPPIPQKSENDAVVIAENQSIFQKVPIYAWIFVIIIVIIIIVIIGYFLLKSNDSSSNDPIFPTRSPTTIVPTPTRLPITYPYLFVSGGSLGNADINAGEQIPFSKVITNNGSNIWNNTQWTCPLDGYYTINTSIFVVSNKSTINSRIAVYINNFITQYIGNVVIGATDVALPISSFTYLFKKNDTLDIRTTQAITIFSAPVHTTLQIYYINQPINPYPYLFVSGGSFDRYTVNAGEQIPFINKIIDTIGNTWNTNLWTCPLDGYYTINTFIFVVSTNSSSKIEICINNLATQFIGNVLNGATDVALPMSSFTQFLKKNDTVDIRSTDTITIWSAPGHTALQIYYTNQPINPYPYLFVSGGPFTGNFTVIDEGQQIPFIKVVTNNGSNIWNNTQWTCPLAGYYTINTFIFGVSNDSGKNSRISIAFNNVITQYIGNVLNGSVQASLPMSSFTQFFKKNDTVDIRTSSKITIFAVPAHTALQIYYISP